jgi:hypothetical protein
MEGLLGHVQWIVTTFGLLATLYGTGTISTGATVGALEHLAVRPFVLSPTVQQPMSGSFRALHRSGFGELIGDNSASLERIRPEKSPAVPDAPKATASLKYARLQTRTGGIGLTVEKPAIPPRAHKPCAEKSGRRSRQRLAVLAHFAFKAKARVF